MKPRIIVDRIVVGGGTAGCLLAAKLSDDFSKSVLLIEGGSNRVRDKEVLAANFFEAGKIANNPKYSKTYQANYVPGQPITYADGDGLGGGSMHNGEQAVRGTRTMWDKWAMLTGDDRWSYDNLLEKVMKPLENYTPSGTEANYNERGDNGALYISQEPPINKDPLIQIISHVTGAPLVPDTNDSSYGDIGLSSNQNWVTPPWNTPGSVRSFSANAFLTGNPSVGTPPIINPDGSSIDPRRQLTVLFDSICNRVLFDQNGDAYAVEFFSTEQKQMVIAYARLLVILCTGSVCDAAILQRSGVGDPKLLASLNIPIVVANPLVGQGLQNHNGSAAVLAPGGKYPYTIKFPQIGSGFIDLKPYMSPGVRRMQLIIVPSPFTPPGINQVLNIPKNSTSVIGLNITPSSRGSVKIVSQNPFVDPIIELNSYSDGDLNTEGTDAYKIVSFYKIMREVARIAETEILFPTPDDYADNSGNRLLKCALSSAPTPAYHNSSTCRMGTSLENSVCDSLLNVRRVGKLKVASNAAAPDVIEDGNTAYQAFMIGAMAYLIISEGL